MKVAVTGGAGALGAMLCDRLLVEGHCVSIFDDLSSGSLVRLADARRQHNRSLQVTVLDVSDPTCATILAKSEPDVVIHLVRPRSAGAVLPVLDGALEGAADRVIVRVSPAALLSSPPDVAAAHEHALLGYLHAYREELALEFVAIAPDPETVSDEEIIDAICRAMTRGGGKVVPIGWGDPEEAHLHLGWQAFGRLTELSGRDRPSGP